MPAAHAVGPLCHAGDFELVWRPEAKVSVLDSGFMLGDGVWEGIRLHHGVLMFIQASTAQNRTVLYCITLCCTVLYCIVLHPSPPDHLPPSGP